MLLSLFLVSCFALMIFDIRNPLAITSVLLILSTGCAFPITILFPASLNVIPNAKGKITAMIFSSRMIITSVSLQIVGYFYIGRFFEIGVALSVTLALAFWFYYRLVVETDPFLTHEVVTET
jgi:DHA1 family bicyclomycin/chloramphenicol resistance-like MFS transporter